jgi:SSS family solute:Na+ symporter
MRIVDIVVLAAYAAFMMGVGVYYSRKNRTAEDYLLGGRSISPLTLGLSLFATLVSTLSYLGHPGEMIAHGPMVLCQIIAFPGIYLIVGYGLIPLLMKQPVTSAYELLEQRLGRSIRLAGATVFLLLRLGWMATILFATSSVVIVPLLGLSTGWIPLICVSLGTATAIYSSSGGLRAVVLTDSIQSLTMLAGAILTLIVITLRMGSVAAWWPDAWPAHWPEPNWGFDPSARISFGMLMLSATLWYVCTNGSDQMSIQRFLSTRNPAHARRTLMVSQMTDAAVSVLLGLTGLAVLGYYSAFPPAVAGDQPVHILGDKLFPMFIMSQMPPGLSGLVLAAILSAALSSLSSGINSACAVIERDFLSSRKRTADTDVSWDARADSDATALKRLKRLSWAIAVTAITLSLLNLLFEGNLIERCYKVVNLLTAPLFVLFFLALFVPWATPLGAWAGLLSAIFVAVSIAYSKELHLPVTASLVWIVPSSLITGVIIGVLVSPLGTRRTSAG